MFRYIVVKLDYLETANQVIYKGLVYNIKLKLAV
jgi:hypothetical protein